MTADPTPLVRPPADTPPPPVELPVREDEEEAAHWRERAACRGATKLFFPPNRGPKSAAERDRAIAICNACPVLDECREWILGETFDPHGGIFAGLTTNQIKGQRRLRRGGLTMPDVCRHGHDMHVAGRMRSDGVWVCRRCKSDIEARYREKRRQEWVA